MIIVAVCTDLMDRSKITAAIDGVRVVRPEADLGMPDVVLVDLRLSAASEVVARAVELGARVVGYGSHVDDTVLTEARDAGAEAHARSVFFRRLADGSLLS